MRSLIKATFYGKNKLGDTFSGYSEYDSVPLPAIGLAACAVSLAFLYHFPLIVTL